MPLLGAGGLAAGPPATAVALAAAVLWGVRFSQCLHCMICMRSLFACTLGVAWGSARGESGMPPKTPVALSCQSAPGLLRE